MILVGGEDLWLVWLLLGDHVRLEGLLDLRGHLSDLDEISGAFLHIW